MSDPHTPEELRPVVEELNAGPVYEDSALDLEEGGEDEYIDADELMNMLGRMQAMLEEQGKELRGLRREMRELREGMAGRGAEGAERSERPSFREGGRDSGREGGYQGRGRSEGQSGRGEGWSPYNRDRNERGGDREFRPREGGGYRGNSSGGSDRGGQGGGQGGFRPRSQGGQGGGYRGNSSSGGSSDRGGQGGQGGGFRPREGGGSDFRNREFRPREGGSTGGGSNDSFRPRPRRDHGWGGKKREE